MPRARANGIEIEYATFGDPERGRPLLLLRGLGTQMIQWHGRFCDLLADAGHFLVIFDNRDVGLSTWLDDREEGYGLDDMADDVVGLMDALGLPTAHVAGISLGGMIAQAVAYRHPGRVRSLVSIMSHTGNPELPPPTPEALAALMERAPAGRDAFIEHHVRTSHVIGSPEDRVPDADRRAMAAAVYDRAFHPEGTARQFAAIVAAGDRRERLAGVRAPTLVVHGLADPLVHPEGGRDTAAHVSGAKRLEIPGMGHEISPRFFEPVARAIAEHTLASEG